MENLNKKKSSKGKIILATIILVILFLLVFVTWVIQSVNSFFNENTLQFNQVLKVELKAPVEVKKREIPQQEVREVVLEYPGEIDTPLKEYICEKFGPYECKTALAVALAESGLREDAININTNKTIDVGVFQINSVHFSKEGCSLKELVDQYKNVNCAYSIFKAQGNWSAWVAYNNGNYLGKL